MKKIVTLALAAIMALVSCGKDDNPQTQDEQIDIKQLIGQWRLQSVTEIW